MEQEADPDPCLALAIRRADRVVTQLYNSYISRSGLRGTQFTVLRAIALNDCVLARDLSEALRMDQTTTSRALKPLIRDGYVETRAAPHDRREKMLCLTSKGRGVYDEAQEEWGRAQSALRERLGDRDSEALLRVSERIAET